MYTAKAAGMITEIGIYASPYCAYPADKAYRTKNLPLFALALRWDLSLVVVCLPYASLAMSEVFLGDCK